MQQDPSLSTHELALRARETPSASFAALYSRVAPALLLWARLHVREALRSRLDPEDLLQETAARAWRKFDGFEAERGSFRAWMFGFARRVLLESLERASSATADAQPLATAQFAALPDDATSVTRSVARRESLDVFARHVDGLPRDDQRLLLYRGLEERPHDEVARLLDTTPEAAAKRWQRLRDRLSAELVEVDFLAA